MTHVHLWFAILLIFTSTLVAAEVPTVGTPLPLLNIESRGELVLVGDDVEFQPWSSGTNPGKVHVVQYFGANMGDKDLFSPFTDLLQRSTAPGSVHVTTVLNLDAAMWGTSGFVISEVKKNKRMHPLATMVLDKKGTGVDTWGLGKEGVGLLILDTQGIVKYFSNRALSTDELNTALQVVKTHSKG